MHHITLIVGAVVTLIAAIAIGAALVCTYWLVQRTWGTPAISPAEEPLRWLAEEGASFVLLSADTKKPIEKGWPDTPRTLADARRHVGGGGNVALLVGEPSDDIICLDVDDNYRQFCRTFPDLVRTVHVTRPNAPDRGKLLFRLDGDADAPNRAWPTGYKISPEIELATDRRTATVPPSIHPSGVVYRMHGKALRTVTRDELTRIWERWTGEPLEQPPQAPDASRIHADVAWRRASRCGAVCEAAPAPAPSDHDDEQPDTDYDGDAYRRDGLLDAVKRAWTAYDVFVHHGFDKEVVREGRHKWRFCGHGGLIVDDPNGDYDWRWYNHSAGRGGDQLDAWAFCTRRPPHYKRDSDEFVAVLVEMARAAGIAVSSRLTA